MAGTTTTPSSPIQGFQGEWRFLSNFWAATIVFDGETYPTVEHAFQAAKTLSKQERQWVRSAERPGEARKRGKKVTLRQNWEDHKLTIMEDLVRQKFQDPTLRESLLATGDRPLEETNNWGDRFWGICNGQGKNHLGRILMKIRAELSY